MLKLFLVGSNAHAGDLLVQDDVFTASESLPPDVLRDYERYYHKVDIRLHRAWTMPGKVLTNARMGVSDAEYARSEIYNDLLRRADAFYALGFSSVVGQERLSLVAHRSKPLGEFSDVEAGRLEMIRPHICRAVLLSRRLRQAEAMASGASGVLDRLPTAVVLVNAGGRVHYANKAADRILSARDGLLLERGTIRAPSPSVNALLQQAIGQAAVLTTGGVNLFSDGVVKAPRIAASPLVILVTPLSEVTRLSQEPRALAAVFILDPDSVPQTSEQRLISLYGLTPAEAALALLLLQGNSVDESAELRGVTRETVRSQLTALLRKTDTSRQSHLLRRLALDAVLLPALPPNV